MSVVRRPRVPAALMMSAAALLAACSSTAPVRPATPADPQAWRETPIPGKPRTRYTLSTKEGQPAWHAQAERSASVWQRPADLAPQQLGQVTFSWWVPALIAEADLRDPDRADAPARVVFGFDGDRSRLSLRNRMMFELAHTMTGQLPPYATLMYVWDKAAPVGSVIPGGRSDRIRKIVVESGPGHLGQWRVYQRDLAADFKLAFGEEPGRLNWVGIMTDADNTASTAESWYGDIVLP